MGEKSKNNKKIGFGDTILAFTQQVEGLSDATTVVTVVLDASVRHAGEKLGQFISERTKRTTDESGNVVSIVIAEEDYLRFVRASRRCGASSTARQLVSRSFLVTLISQFDAFLGNLIRLMYATHPDMLKGSERSLTYSQLVQFKSLEEARDSVVDKEVETVLRKSHTDQIAWLENKLDITLRDGLEAWPIFIEATERRNLFVHCDGRVSEQYLNACRVHKVKISPVAGVGDVLGCDHAYFRKAKAAVFEVAVKLGHVLWRKLLPKDLSAADTSLNAVSYDLLQRHEYQLAIPILKFAYEQKRHSDEKSRLYFLINLAQAYKWQGLNEECMDLLEKEDWTACNDELVLASQVLREDYEGAIITMKRIGKGSDLTEGKYRDWPVFREFRNTTEFLDNYEQIFGVPFENLDDGEERVSMHDLSKYLTAEEHSVSAEIKQDNALIADK